LEKVFYTNESTGLDAWEAELPTVKYFQLLLFGKIKPIKSTKFKNKEIAFNQAELLVEQLDK
jgi:hypothetical protein